MFKLFADVILTLSKQSESKGKNPVKPTGSFMEFTLSRVEGLRMTTLGTMVFRGALMLSPIFLVACGPSSTTYQSQTAAAVEWKSELIVNVAISRDVEVGKKRMVFEFHSDSKMDAQPAMLYSVPVLAPNENGKIKASYDFTDLTSGTYYVRAYFDENSNAVFDTGEASGVYNVKGEPSPITIETGKRQAISLSVE